MHFDKDDPQWIATLEELESWWAQWEALPCERSIRVGKGRHIIIVARGLTTDEADRRLQDARRAWEHRHDTAA